MFNGKDLFTSLKFGLRLKIYKDSKILNPTLSSRVISKILNDSTDTAAPHVFSAWWGWEGDVRRAPVLGLTPLCSDIRVCNVRQVEPMYMASLHCEHLYS